MAHLQAPRGTVVYLSECGTALSALGHVFKGSWLVASISPTTGFEAMLRRQMLTSLGTGVSGRIPSFDILVTQSRPRTIDNNRN
jgi:hypothetical protein